MSPFAATPASFSAEKSTTGRSNVSVGSERVAGRSALRRAPAPVRLALGGLSRATPGLALPLARRLFLTPQRFAAPRREWWWGTSAEAFELEVPLASGMRRLAAWRWGAPGPTVVLVHGWSGRGLQMGALAAPLVDAGFQVVTFDLPAHGLSPGRSSSLTEAAEAIGAVLDHFQATAPGGVHGLVAHSFGCVATTLALARRKEVEDGPRVVFLASPSDLDGVLDHFRYLTGFSRQVMERLRGDLERRFEIRWQSVHPRRLAPSLHQPLLVIHDTEDSETPWTEGRRLVESWPGARLHVTAGLGHFRLLRDAGVVGEVAAFLATGDGDSGAMRSAA